MSQEQNLDNLLNDKITDYSQISKKAGRGSMTKGKSLDHVKGISIGISTKEEVLGLSHGEVLISETINYRTQKPERGGLFCEQIFGPRKNYECACGKYKGIRYKGITCERCGVDVTTSQVRRQRMGHIELAVPVAHIWFLKSVPSRIGLLLDVPLKKLEQVIYFAAYIVTDIDEEKRQEALLHLEESYKKYKVELQKEYQGSINEARISVEAKEMTKKAFAELERQASDKLDALDVEYTEMKSKLGEIQEGMIIGELDYQMLYDRFSHVFKAGSGAEAVKVLLDRINLVKVIKELEEESKIASKARQVKLLQKLKLAVNLHKSGQKPGDFVLETLQVVPPDLRPMIQLDGGRMASSDLNDLYRRVINRNNRLRKLMQLGAPDVILKNEKRMLQEAVDALISGDVRSSRSGYAMANRRKLKSLTDILKGKQGRFRQNLLGKRVDYSGRSVIVVGPNLGIDECGLPKKMALTLFKPFIIGKLIEKEVAFNIKHAEKVIEEKDKEVWDALEEAIQGKHVLLNRAPTLHRLGIQAFRPVLIDGKAIQLHPLTCVAFNADFDGDQMAVHLPLTPEAQKEAANLMVTSKNILNPSNGEPIVSPTQDMILGCYYLTRMDKPKKNALSFGSMDEVTHAYDNDVITLHTAIRVRGITDMGEKSKDYTSYGRMIFNTHIPESLQYVNETIKKGTLQGLLAQSFDLFGGQETAKLADVIKNLGFKYATQSGLSIAISDMISPDNKIDAIVDSEAKINQIQQAKDMGLLTEDEKYEQSIKIWSETKKAVESEMKKGFDADNHIYNFIDSGARGNWGQATQLCGMKGLVASPSGKTIELPIKSNLKEGFSTLEYFIATHGGRKGKADTALKTAQSGYMTRKLVDSAQSLLIREEDCGTLHFQEYNKDHEGSNAFSQAFEEKIYGKTVARDVKVGSKVVISAGTVIDKDVLADIMANDKITRVDVRTVISCETPGGACQKCYGLDLATDKEIAMGAPIGIVAAQSIGEPGTQLTMRTFHSGGVAKEGGDITQGLARVEELFEARTPKYLAEIADISGVIANIERTDKGSSVTLVADELHIHEYYVPKDFNLDIKTGQEVKAKQIIARASVGRRRISTAHEGIVEKIEDGIVYIKDVKKQEREYVVPASRTIIVKEGQKVEAGDPLIHGQIDPHHLMAVAGPEKTEKYIIGSVKKIYASQGQTVNSKHIELIVRQMFSKVRIIDPGDSDFFPGDIIDIDFLHRQNEELAGAKQQEIIAERLILGITKAALFTDSWLSAASFQETVRVLVDASILKKVDKLDGLKNNVIIGRRIPTLKYFYENVHHEDDHDVQEARGTVEAMADAPKETETLEEAA